MQNCLLSSLTLVLCVYSSWEVELSKRWDFHTSNVSPGAGEFLPQKRELEFLNFFRDLAEKPSKTSLRSTKGEFEARQGIAPPTSGINDTEADLNATSDAPERTTPEPFRKDDSVLRISNQPLGISLMTWIALLILSLSLCYTSFLLITMLLIYCFTRQNRPDEPVCPFKQCEEPVFHIIKPNYITVPCNLQECLNKKCCQREENPVKAFLLDDCFQ